MQKPSERRKFTSEINIIKFKKSVHDHFIMSSVSVHVCVIELKQINVILY